MFKCAIELETVTVIYPINETKWEMFFFNVLDSTVFALAQKLVPRTAKFYWFYWNFGICDINLKWTFNWWKNIHQWIVHLLHVFIEYYWSIYFFIHNQNKNNEAALMHFSFVFTELRTFTTVFFFPALQAMIFPLRNTNPCYPLSSSLQGSGHNESSNQSLCSVGSLSDKELEVSTHLELMMWNSLWVSEVSLLQSIEGDAIVS